MPELHPLIQIAALVLGPTGACWAAVKSSLNGTKRAVQETREDVKEIRKELGNHGERLAKIEGKVGER